MPNHEHLSKPLKVLKLTAGSVSVMPFEQECINFIPYLTLTQTIAFLILKINFRHSHLLITNFCNRTFSYLSLCTYHYIIPKVK